MIKEMCHSIRKPGKGALGYAIFELSVSRLKLLSFWAKHMWRTSRGVDDWTETTWDDISDLANQKALEDDVRDTAPPNPPELTLDTRVPLRASPTSRPTSDHAGARRPAFPLNT